MANVTLHDGWVIRESGYHPDEETSRATIFALANGYLGLRGAGEELPAKRQGEKGCIINGLYDTPEGKLTEREVAGLPDFLWVDVVVDGERLDLTTGELLFYSRELDLRAGETLRKVRWRSPGGKTIELTSRRVLGMARHHRAAHWVQLVPEQDCDVVMTFGIDGEVSNRWANHTKAFRPSAGDGWVAGEMDTFDPGYTVAVRVETAVDLGDEELTREWRTSPTRAEEVLAGRVSAGRAITLDRRVAVYDSLNTPEGPVAACVQELAAGAEEYEAFRAEQAKVWDVRWKETGIEIEGDEDALLGIRFSTFHLLGAAPFHSDRVSIPARGLQGQDYYGSIFWDCEIFVAPMFAYTQPKAARNILGYRVHTLDGARHKAARFGWRGAYFSWQSQEAGEEQCDLYVFTNPLTGEKIRSYFADEQIHISADVVYAMWQYYEATGDAKFWCEGGAEVATEVARFFVSRATWNAEKARYELLTVLGPDEYHENVDNNAYTNALAAFAADKACVALQLAAKQDPEGYKALCERIGLTDAEIAGFREFAATMYVPAPDPQTKLIEQFDGYFQLKDEAMDATRARLAHPDLHPGGPAGPFQETQNTKQADAIMLLYLLRDRYDQDTKLKNWQYYEPRTSHDSSLSPMAYSLVAADVEMLQWAYKYYIYTSHIDLESYGPHWNLGVHAASLGGAWLAIVHGFCRLSLGLEGVKLSHWPALPDGWKSVTVPFVWHGVPMKLKTDGKTTTLTNEGEKPVKAILPDGEATVAAGASLTRQH